MRKIDLSTSLGSCWPRIIWQELFNLYRLNGGDLGNMDNMLIDLTKCEEVVERAAATGEPEQFVWACHRGSFITTWAVADQWKGCSLDTVVEVLGFDRVVLGTVVSNCEQFATFEILQPRCLGVFNG